MKVAHRDDYDTHAVIGGNEVMEFGIAQTAEFFTVLSNTLYTNKPLAVIREVLCNAWDAHIVEENTKTPVKITLDEEKLVIRDFGPGIHPNNMHKVYCVYGASTKENDGLQTGGFGLGSKAPFAYSDHFTVITYHAGIKTVYAISRGSALTKGKPDMRVMVRVPTTETGLEVMIPIKSRGDVEVLEGHIRHVARFGEMNVTLNDEPIETVPISKSENNIFLTKENFTTAYETIYVRYGNVVYPVPISAEYISNLTRVEELVKKIKAGSGYRPSRYRLILKAPPNSISVSPSRESLSLSETTVDTVNRLLAEVYHHINYEDSIEYAPILDEIYDKTFNWYFQKMKIMELYTDVTPYNSFAHQHLPGNTEAPNMITNKRDLLFHVLRSQEKINDYAHMMQNLRIAKLLHNDQHPRSFLSKHFIKMFKDGWMTGTRNTFERKAFRPLVRGLAKTDGLKPKDMLVYSPSHKASEPGVFQHVNEFEVNPKNILAFLKPVVVLTYSRKAFMDDFHSMKTRHIVPKKTPVLVYVVTRSKIGLENAQAFFKKMGFHVVDFASYVEKTEVQYRSVQRAYASPRKEVPAGLPTLQNLIYHGHFKANGHISIREGAQIRSTTYTHVLQPHCLSGADWNKQFFPWGDSVGRDIVKLFQNDIGICTNIRQVENQKKQGKGDGILHIVQTITDNILTNPRIRTYLELQSDHRDRTGQIDTMFKMGADSDILRQVFDLPEVMTIEDRRYYDVFDYLRSKHNRYANDGWDLIIKDAMKEVEILKQSTRWEGLHQKVSRSKTFDLLDISMMATRLKRAVEEHDMKTKTFIEISVINSLE